MFRKFLLIIICLVAVKISTAQDFNWKASVKPVTESGFYSIPLSADIVAKLEQESLSDIRIISDHKEVPYVLKFKPIVNDQSSFSLLSPRKKSEHNKLTEIVVSTNSKHEKIDKLILILKNTSAKKYLAVSGSYDEQKWFTVKPSFEFDPINGYKSKSTEINFDIDFPTSDYNFYKIVINDSVSEPLYIVGIGRIINSVNTQNEFTAVPDPIISLLKSPNPKQSVFKLDFKEPYLIKKCQFGVKAPAFFLREVSLAKQVKRVNKRGKEELDYEVLENFKLASGKDQEIIFDKAIKEKTLYLIVQNDDNPALQFSQIKVYQQNCYLVSYLEKGKDYELRFGNAKADEPRYDIVYFSEKITDSLISLTVQNIQPSQVSSVSASKTIFSDKKWIWGGLILIVGLLSFISFRMIKEMSGKKGV